MNKVSELLPLAGTIVIDVRTPDEFVAGHFSKSINIPLAQLGDHLEELKGMQNIIVCCASGIRSQKASNFLKQNNIDCCDGGSWLDIRTHSNN